MARIVQIGKTKVYKIFCSGCKTTHNINCNPTLHGAWSYTGTENTPTISKPLKIISIDKNNKQHICEFTITGGQISYDKKCTHLFAGRKVEMVEIKDTL